MSDEHYDSEEFLDEPLQFDVDVDELEPHPDFAQDKRIAGEFLLHQPQQSEQAEQSDPAESEPQQDLDELYGSMKDLPDRRP